MTKFYTLKDKYKGNDDRWHTITDIQNVRLSYNMYTITIDDQSIQCAYSKTWNISIKNKIYLVDTETIYNKAKYYKGKHINNKNGPIIKDIKKVKEELVQCITTNDGHCYIHQIYN